MTVTINPTPPAAPVGSVSVDRVGMDTAGNIWMMYPRVYSGGSWSGGWTYAATQGAALPLEADAPADAPAEEPTP